MKDGEQYMIGSDTPHQLAKAINLLRDKTEIEQKVSKSQS
jgi:hypothetical protein